EDRAPATYSVRIGGDEQEIPPGGSVVFDGLPAGDHEVEIEVSGPCAVVGDNPQTVTVAGEETARASFDVACTAGLIAFTSTRDGNNGIYVMDADGSNPVRFTDNPAVDTQPAWSPDGTRIAFVSARDGNNDIFIMDADGENLVNVTNHPATDTEPAWSPDGTR